MAFAISIEQGATEEERPQGKPWWMRQSDPVPCNCKTRFQCKNGITYGISHPVMPAAMKTPAHYTKLACPGCDNLLICQQCWDAG